MKFRLLAGIAHIPDATNPSTDGMGTFRVMPGQKKPVIVECDRDLCEAFGTTKFERVDGPSSEIRDRAEKEVNDVKVMDKGKKNLAGLPTGGGPKKKGGEPADNEDQILGQKATRGKQKAKIGEEDEPEPGDDEAVIANMEDEPDAESAPEADEVEEPADYGKDTTTTFAKDIGPKNKGKVSVKNKGGEYYVFDKDGTEPLNADPLHKNKVGGFIKDYLKG